MSQSIETTSLSKEMSSEESYSKTSISSSTTMMSSQESSLKSSAIMDSSALVSQLESDLSLKALTEGSVTGSKMATLEKSSSLAESESSISIKKAEMSSTIEESSTSTSMSMKKEQSIKMTSEEISKSATYEAVSLEGSLEKFLLFGDGQTFTFSKFQFLKNQLTTAHVRPFAFTSSHLSSNVANFRKKNFVLKSKNIVLDSFHHRKLTDGFWKMEIMKRKEHEEDERKKYIEKMERSKGHWSCDLPAVFL